MNAGIACIHLLTPFFDFFSCFFVPFVVNNRISFVPLCLSARNRIFCVPANSQVSPASAGCVLWTINVFLFITFKSFMVKLVNAADYRYA